MEHFKGYIKEHPRPRLTRDDFMILDGTWRFRFDDQDEGLEGGWMHGLETTRKIVVPFAYQTKSGVDGRRDTTSSKTVW